MQYQIRCPNCGTRMGVGLKEAGLDLVCHSCNDTFLVPTTGITAGTTSDGIWVKRRVGGGHCSDLFEASRIKDSEKLLLKVMCPLLTGEPDLLREYLDGIQKVMLISHPNIVAPLQTGPLLGHVFIAFPPLAGICLDVYVAENGPMAEKEVLKMATKVARALQHAWDTHQLLHHALKPANLLLDEQSQIMVLDFNQQRLLLATSNPGLQRLAGAPPNYFSPEQIEGRLELDVRSDIYALGCTLFYLTTGQPPFPGDDVAEIFGMHLQTPAPAPSSMNPAVTSSFDAMVARMLAKDREERYGSWEEVLVAVREVANKQSRTTTHTKLHLAVQPKNHYAADAAEAAATVAPPAAAPAKPALALRTNSGKSPAAVVPPAAAAPAAAAAAPAPLTFAGVPLRFLPGQMTQLHLKILLWTAFIALAIIVFCLATLLNRQGHPRPIAGKNPPKSAVEEERDVQQEKLFDAAMRAIKQKPPDLPQATKLLRQVHDAGPNTPLGKQADQQLAALQAPAPKPAAPATATPPTKPPVTPPTPAPPSTTKAVPAPTLKLLPVRATAASERNRNLAVHAIDGNAATRWESEPTDPQWLRLDLGGVYTINEVTLQWDASYAKAYELRVSNDGKEFKSVYTAKNGTGGKEHVKLNGVSGRHLELLCIARATTNGYSLIDLEVQGSKPTAAAPAPTPATPQPPPATPPKAPTTPATPAAPTDTHGW